MAFFARNGGATTVPRTVTVNSVTVFHIIETNVGNAYNATTGLFTAPLGGVYVFHLHYGTDRDTDTELAIQANGRTVCDGNAQKDFAQGVCSAIVRLTSGDVVTVRAIKRARVMAGFRCGFSGFLLPQ